MQEYQRTLVIDPHFVDGLFNLAVDTASNEPLSAEQLYRKVVSLQPSWAGAWLNLGFVLQSEGKGDEARVGWAKAVSLQAPEPHHRLSSVRVRVTGSAQRPRVTAFFPVYNQAEQVRPLLENSRPILAERSFDLTPRNGYT